MILWSIHTFWYKGSAEIKGKWQVQKRALSQKNSPGLKVGFSPKGQQINEIDNSQMGCECYTCYKSNPIYQISYINNKNRIPAIIGNSDFSGFCVSLYIYIYIQRERESQLYALRHAGAEIKLEPLISWSLRAATSQRSDFGSFCQFVKNTTI